MNGAYVLVPQTPTIWKLNEKGEYFSTQYPGEHSFYLHDLKELIDEYDIPSIQLGQKVSIKTDATRDDELEGVIDEIAEASSASSEPYSTSVSWSRE